MSVIASRLRDFVKFVHQFCQGRERGEAQSFCDQLIRALGHASAMEAGGTFEAAQRYGKRTRFIDYSLPPRVLIEMKTRGEKLEKHYNQAFDYWIHHVPHRPAYVILCNFDEFWIYDFNIQLNEPMDRIKLEELPDRYTAFGFLLPEKTEPVFKENWVAVTELAAKKIGRLFRSLTERGEERYAAQRFVLQCVVALFAQNIEMLPEDIFTKMIDDCLAGRENSYDLFGDLFRQMNTDKPAKGGRFKNVPYFNGGLFARIEPIELTKKELSFLHETAQQNWAKVRPSIFGSMFEATLNEAERHSIGGHYTSEADIQQVVLPTITKPWRQKIAAATSIKALAALREELAGFRVLDPACGSGNFLYVAYRDLKRVEIELLQKMTELSGKTPLAASTISLVSAKQFMGIDSNPFAVDLAKVTLMLGKKLAIDEFEKNFPPDRDLFFEREKPIPLDNLDDYIVQGDAILRDWPKADAIIGNPPYQSKNKLQQILPLKEIRAIRERYPQVSGRADYCVYWFRKAHDCLSPGGRAGLVGTNTIRQNYSRESGLDYIVNNDGTIVEAVSSQPWSGDAAVNVSIVNWIKGPFGGDKQLFLHEDTRKGPVRTRVVKETINSSLSPLADVSGAIRLQANIQSDACYQGQTHGHEGFLLTPEEASEAIRLSARNRDVIFPFLTADELIGEATSQPNRYVIDFSGKDLLEARTFKAPFERIELLVLPTRKDAARSESNRNATILDFNPSAKVNHHHRNFLKRWWMLSYPREELIRHIAKTPRYIACGQVTKRPIFEFVESTIRPNAALIVFPVPDDYSFGILQSGIHWAWFTAKCSTLTERFRYTSDTVFDTFPWPQKPKKSAVDAVAAAAVELRLMRRNVMKKYGWSLRELYRSLEVPGENVLRNAHQKLDATVQKAYGMSASADPLEFLLELNSEVAKGWSQVVGPGLPWFIKNSQTYITADCVQPAPLPELVPGLKMSGHIGQRHARKRPG